MKTKTLTDFDIYSVPLNSIINNWNNLNLSYHDRQMILVDIHLIKVNNKNTRTRCEICSKCLYCWLWTYFTPSSSASIDNFEHVIAGWVGIYLKHQQISLYYCVSIDDFQQAPTTHPFSPTLTYLFIEIFLLEHPLFKGLQLIDLHPSTHSV